MVLLFSIDGLRPDALGSAHTPAIDRLIKHGSSTMQAQTVMRGVTRHGHTSMFRGVDGPRHGINTNIFHPIVRPVPSLFDVATRSGQKCGAFFNWGPLRDLYDPESVAVAHYVRDAHRPEGDNRVADAAAKHVEGLDFAFVYFGFVDECGHEHGWMSDEYLKAVENADRCVGEVLSHATSPTALLLSDHGGHERTHGTDSPEDMTIPFILSGPGASVNVNISDEVRIFDVPPTLAHLLEIPVAREWDGKAVRQALS